MINKEIPMPEEEEKVGAVKVHNRQEFNNI